VQMRDPQTKRTRYIGSYASEEDAARAYDCAAVQAHGPGAKRNFPGEDISELPETVGEERKQHTSSWSTRNQSAGRQGEMQLCPTTHPTHTPVHLSELVRAAQWFR
jgi:hypothetical protein